MEFNVDRYVKTYWNKFIGLTDTNENEEIADATSENSVRASKFLEWLNLDPIMPELNKYYSVPEGKEDFPRRAMFKAMVWKKLLMAQLRKSNTTRGLKTILKITRTRL